MTTQARGDGLERVIAADTAISDVDGERGRLTLAGHDVEALAHASYEDVLAAVWASAGLDVPHDLRAQLGRARVHAFAELSSWRDALGLPDAMDALRSALARLRSGTDETADAVRLLATAAVVASAWARVHDDLAPIEPDATLGHAEDTLRTIRDASDPARARGFERYLVTVIDHGMNASTFAARVVASTGSDAVSAVVAGIGALKGPLHGGAPGPVLDMLDAIGEPERARAWLEAELAASRRIMGMGHRVYRVRDPRAAVLEAAIDELEREATSRRLALARAVESSATALLAERHPERVLKANVEFYTAVLLEAVGVPRSLFTASFACSRIGGWLAHVGEQRRHGRLIRPGSRYVGRAPASV
jgi:citrate synthase